MHECVPEATETIAYGIPTFRLHGNQLQFGAYEKHIGFYPTPSVIYAFAADLQPYGSAKGSVRFLLNRPIPYELIERMVRHRLEEQGTAR